MASDLSPQSERYLEQVVATGLYASKEAALNAAIAALREKNEQLPMISEEHMALVEEAMEAAEAGDLHAMTQDDWARLRQRAHDVADGKKPVDD